MKKILIALIISVLLVLVSGNAQGQFYTENFEDITGYSTSISEFSDNGTDFFGNSSTLTFGSAFSVTSYIGSAYFAAEDIDAEGATLPVNLTIDNIDITGYTDLVFKIYLAEDDDGTNQDWDASDYLHILYDIDNSTTFSNLLWVESSGGTNTEPKIDTDFDGTGDGTAITSTFTQHSANIPETGADLDIKIIFNLNSGDEDIAIDHIEIFGTSSSTPTITLSETNLTGFTYIEGSGPSAEQSFTIEGSNLTNNISIAPPSNYEISTGTGGAFSATNPITLTQSGGSVSTTTIYVRLKSGLSVANYNDEDITASSTGATDKTLECDGSVTCPSISAPVATTGTTIAGTSFTANWNSVSGATGYELDVYQSSSSPELVLNGGFETGDGSNWSKFETNYTVVSSDGSVTPHSGSEMVKCFATDTRDLAQDITFTADGTSTYELSFWYRYESSSDLEKLRLWSQFTAGSYTGDNLESSTYLSATETWTKVTYTITPSAGSNTLHLELRTYSTGKAYIDDISFKKNGSGTTYILQNEDVGNVTNYIVTGLTADETYNYVVRAYNSCGSESSNSNEIEVTTTSSAATITLSESNLSGFTYNEGSGPSAEQSFTVEGSNLTNDISLSPPVNYEISTGTGGAFSATNPITLTQAGGSVNSTIIYVRLKTGLSAATYDNENITASSTGATNQTVECDGNVSVVGACATDLIISEYGEGSSNNKYIEIYNGTGASIDLSQYILKQSYNGAGWDSDPNSCYNKPLSGTIANDDVFIIAASDADATILAEADITISYDAASQGGKIAFFSGNDAIGLFKGAVLIDLFGDPSSGSTIPVAGYSTYGSDHTIVRKDNIYDGNTDWTSSSGTNTTDSEWIGFSQDTWTYLGDHDMFCTPVFTISEDTLNGFSYYVGNGPSVEQTYTVSGQNLSNDISLTAPTNYEISETSGSGFGTSLTLTETDGEVTETTIYVRLISSLAIAEYNDEYIVISTNGLSNDTVTCNGEVLMSPVTNLDVICTTNNSATIEWTAPAGTYDGVIIAVRNSTNSPHTISDGTNPSTISANATFTSGTEFGSTTPYSYIVYKGTGTNVTITGLTAGENYKIKAYTYTGTNWLDDSNCPTTSILNLGVLEVSSINKVNGNTQGEISWNPPTSSCYDEVLIICTEGSSTSATPSGDGSSYTANSTFGSGSEITTDEYVVFKGTSSSVTITSLTNGLTYYATIFVRYGTQWSTGTEVILNPDDVTFLEYGDLAIVAVNTNGTTGDEFSFVSFIDISAGTTIDFTDNGYERISSGLWADSEGFLSFTRQNSSISAGKIITFECIGNVGTPALGTNVNVYLDGMLDNANWTASSSGSGSGFNFNSADQIWVMQGGTWSDPAGVHNATYSGTVLYGWTAIGWEATEGYDDTAGSTIFPSCECATTNVAGLTNNSKVKYDGDVTPITKTGWIGRINNPANWDDYADNTTYDAGTPLYKQDGATFPIEAGDLTDGKWAGYKSSEWCDCANWWSLKVPDASVNVEIPVVTSPNHKLVLEDDTDCTTECNTIEIFDTVTNNMGAIFIVKGDFTLNTGTIEFNTNTIDLQIGGNIVIDDASKFLTSAADLTMNGSSSQTFDVEGPTLETIELNSLSLTSGGTKTIADNLDIATDLTVDNSILNSSASGSSLTIDGNLTLQNGATMHNNCKSNLDIILSTSTSQILRSSGNSIKALSITADKTNADLSLSTTGGLTNLELGSLGDFNFTGTGTFTDNSGTIQTDDDLYFGGDGTSNYNLTGTVSFTGTNVIGDIVLADDDGLSAISAELHNLTVQGGELEIYPSTGSQTIVVKNDFTIQFAARTDANGNNLEIGGNYSVNSDASMDASSISVALNGINDQNIYANGDIETFGTLVINKASGNVNLSDNIDANELNLTSGLINTGTNRVYVSNTSPSNLSNYSTSSYINGNLRRAVASSGSYDLPVGNSSNYELANININSSTGLSYLNASFNPIDAGDLDISGLGLTHGGVNVETILDAGFWTIEPDAGMSFISYNIGLSLSGATNAGTAPEQHTVIKRTNSSTDWSLPGHHDNSTQTIGGGVVYAYRDHISSMSDFAIAKNNTNVLPVELISFELRCNNNSNILSWITASEINNDYFEVQRSIDALKWESIAIIEGAGNSSKMLLYSFTDKSFDKTTYYRLKQVDFDGKYEYSDILISNCYNNSIESIELYPNPTFGTVNIKIVNWHTDKINVEVYDMMGRIVYNSDIELFNGMQTKTIDFSSLNTGLYHIRFMDNNKTLLLKFDKK